MAREDNRKGRDRDEAPEFQVELDTARVKQKKYLRLSERQLNKQSAK